MSNTIFLVAYVTENNEVKSATIFTDVSYSGTLGPRAFEHYAQAVKVKTGDTVKYLLDNTALIASSSVISPINSI